MINVGIPRALLYYQYFPMWKTFFEELGADVVVSPPTTRAVIASGSSRVVADTCLPVKVFLGHVLSLIGRCDYIFIPAIRSLKSKIYNCSKFLGLPDMTRAVITECPAILDVDVDISKGKSNLYKAINKLGRYFTRSASKVERASMDAWQAHLKYRQLMSNYGLTPLKAMNMTSSVYKADDSYNRTETENNSGKPVSNQATIALIGHPYLLYDEYLNHRIIHRLEQAGNRVLTPEMLTVEELESASVRLAGTTYWTFGEEVVGAGEHYLQSAVDGIIGILTFGCGPDSLMMEMVRRRANKLKTTPFMSLVLEEHTAETGMITRLEAFLDMINRKKRGRQ
jgi:predicted nucleotide-binding protein (sugar kinase/HSP70/actin superfamily)